MSSVTPLPPITAAGTFTGPASANAAAVWIDRPLLTQLGLLPSTSESIAWLQQAGQSLIDFFNPDPDAPPTSPHSRPPGADLPGNPPKPPEGGPVDVDVTVGPAEMDPTAPSFWEALIAPHDPFLKEKTPAEILEILRTWTIEPGRKLKGVYDAMLVTLVGPDGTRIWAVWKPRGEYDDHKLSIPRDGLSNRETAVFAVPSPQEWQRIWSATIPDRVAIS
jgi:hypothetical protein